MTGLSRLDFLEMILANDFALSEAENITSWSLYREGIADLLLLRKLLQNSLNVTKTKFLGSNAFVCFSSICKFGSFKNPFTAITSLFQLYFRLRNFTLLVQTKEIISANYGSNTSSWKSWRWVRLDLILTMRNIYIKPNVNPLTKFSRSSSKVLRYPPMKHLSNNPEDHLNQH